MASLSERPPFILAFLADSQGCGWHRIQVPMGSLLNVGLAEGRIDMRPWPVEQIVAANPDVIVWQRQVEEGMFDLMASYRKALPNVFMIYEIDDFFAGLPPKSFWSGFIPSNVEERIMRGIALCDAVTTTTERLAAWLRERGAKDVRVAPNVVPMSRMRRREQPKPGTKLRIGWAGSLSHEGDIELLDKAMADIGEAVEWVFMGIQPKNPPVRVEFHEGVPVNTYMDEMEKLNLDLLLGPLEDNEFNRCKSNLRLLDAGALNVPVIAQRIIPYTEGDPPVFAYCETPEDWSREISRFIAAPPKERQMSADALQRWVSRYFTVEANMHKRLAAWSPNSTDDNRFRPRATQTTITDTVIVSAEKREFPGMPSVLRKAPIYSTLEEGARAAMAKGANLLWLRPGTDFDVDTWRALTGIMAENGEPDGKTAPVAAAMPLSPDGPNAFPRLAAFTPTQARTGIATAKALRAVVPGKRLNVLLLGGPCVFIGKHALAHFGVPDVIDNGDNEEVAILEWGFRAATKGWRIMQAADAYAWTMAAPIPATQEQVQRLQARGYAPLLQVQTDSLSPEERRDIELQLLRFEWEGPRPGLAGFAGDYAAWSLLRDSALPSHELRCDIKVQTYGKPFPDAEWVVPAGAILRPGALARFSEVCAKAGPEVMVVYADHETMGLDGKPNPWFKPDFDATLYLAYDYVTPVCAVRTSLIPGGKTELDHDLLPIIIVHEQNGYDSRKNFIHIPEILGATVDDAPELMAVKTMIRHDIVQKGFGQTAEVTVNRRAPGALTVTPRLVEDDWRPVVSVIIPTKGDGWLLEPCLNTLLGNTAYPKFEVLLVMTGEGEPQLGAAVGNTRLRIIYDREKPFNWSGVNNRAVKEAAGEILCFMNDDTRVPSVDWLDKLVAHVVKPGIGAVGPKMLFPQGMVQHIGVIVHKGICVHLHKGMPVNLTGYRDIGVLTHEASAVTGACMLVSREHYDEVGGFDENLRLNYNDVDFCMQLGKKGYRHIVDCSVELLHLEGSTRSTSGPTKEWLDQLRDDNNLAAKRWAAPDPYWNPNFALGVTNNGMNIAGANCEILAWDETTPPADAERVLYVNPVSSDPNIVVERKHSAIIMTAELSNLILTLTAPKAENVGMWNLRFPVQVGEDLRKLGIKRIVLRSLVGPNGSTPPVETLRALSRLGVPVTALPSEDLFLAPWDTGADEAALYPAVEQIFGLVDLEAWHKAYDRLFNEADSRSSAEAAE
jgi:GT2 family glycosyltransferase